MLVASTPSLSCFSGSERNARMYSPSACCSLTLQQYLLETCLLPSNSSTTRRSSRSQTCRTSMLPRFTSKTKTRLGVHKYAKVNLSDTKLRPRTATLQVRPLSSRMQQVFRSTNSQQTVLDLRNKFRCLRISCLTETGTTSSVKPQ